jgi:hypothetical protein
VATAAGLLHQGIYSIFQEFLLQLKQIAAGVGVIRVDRNSL